MTTGMNKKDKGEADRKGNINKKEAVHKKKKEASDKKIRYRIFILRSKADSSQLNLPHCTITEKIMTRNSKKKRKISEVPKATKSCEITPNQIPKDKGKKCTNNLYSTKIYNVF